MKKFFRRVATLLFWLGLVGSAFTLAFELSTHACASDHFDPLPSWLHVVLVALVPVALLGVWLAGRKADARWLGGASFLHGLALAPILYYLLALGPLTLVACWMLLLTIPFILHGELGLFMLVLATAGPLLALLGWWVAAVRLRRWRREHLAPPSRRLRRPWLSGLVAGVLALGAAELPLVLLYEDLCHGLRISQGEERDDVPSLEALRTPGREAFLLHLCYAGGKAGNFGPLAHLFDTGPLDDLARAARFPEFRAESLDLEDLRELYFRVTGHVFSDMPPPRSHGARRSGTRLLTGEMFGNLTWDEERGGAKVGVRLRGLSLATSRMDWHLDKHSALAHGEWTLEFRNTNANAQEARCQMLLPPGGCVSRLTLWINGEPREAAFGSKQQVTQAYQQTVVVDRRDPVLVNMVGPDRVMTQCFPVPPNGTMKIRLGITAPVDERVQQRLALPLVIERNFSIPAALKHAVWVQGGGEFALSQDKKPIAKDGQWSWQGEVPHEDLETLRLMPKDAGAAKVWAEDPFATASEGKTVLRVKTAGGMTTAAPQNVIAVVDGSTQLRPHAQAIREALKALAVTHTVSVLLSRDGKMPRKLEKAQWETELVDQAFRGGRDSTSSLQQALQDARSSGQRTTIVWLHGPQPFEFAESGVIAQIFEREPHPPVVHSIALAHGRNRLLEQLYNHAELRAETRWDGTPDHLRQILQQACAGMPDSYAYSRPDAAPADAIKVWDQLARQAVFEEVLAAFKGQNQVPEAQAQRAASHQLVTPYSGAVVLETQEQYDRAGLKPVDAGSTPQIPNGSVPEPHRTLLLLIGVVACSLRRRR